MSFNGFICSYLFYFNVSLVHLVVLAISFAAVSYLSVLSLTEEATEIWGGHL